MALPFNGMQGMIAAYIASPQGQEAIQKYLSSPEGKKTLDDYLATPAGQEMAQIVLSRALDATDLPQDIRAKILSAVRDKTKPQA